MGVGGGGSGGECLQIYSILETLMLVSCLKRYGMDRISRRMKLWCMDFKEMVPIPKFGSRGCYEEGIIQPSLQRSCFKDEHYPVLAKWMELYMVPLDIWL
ncbi:hypothetical protein Hdeb2414_s0010g00342711 [Helianthus debilis subsp. tardiflorus]